jgi:ABC-type bacteriocin/lantibiotic exporter with double-glycine peptidase domain
LLSVINVCLDLLSIAYLIPLFIFILDKNQMPNVLKKMSFFNESYLVFWVIGIISLFIIKNIIQITIIKFQSTFVFDIATELSSKLTKQFMQKSFIDIQQMNKGKEIQKIQMSGTDFANHILLSVNTLFTELTIISIISIISFVLYPIFTIFIFIISLICLYVLYRIRKHKIDQVSHTIRTSYSTSTSHLLNIIDGFIEIKSLKKESFFKKKYVKALTIFNANFATLKKHQSSNAKYLEIFIIIGLSLFLYYTNSLIESSSQKVLLIAYVAGVSLKLFPSLNKIIIAYTNYKSFSYTLDVFSEKSTESVKETVLKFNKTLSLQNVSFSYKEGINLLENINLTINKGEIIGIKGRSGIGKTTLLNVIMGLIQPNEGQVLLDNLVINTNKNRFNIIGYVPQHPFLFQGSLLSNLVMDESRDKIDFKRLNNLIDAFELTDFVANLSNGFDTKISHDSLSVSGGQKQRIAIIRALYAQPELLILDEVTNQLDENLEHKVMYYLKNYAKSQHIAIILVSHSSFATNMCDKSFKITQHTLVEM